MAADFDDHRRIFDACPERVEGAAMIFKAPPQLGQCSISMSKTRLSSRAQLITVIDLTHQVGRKRHTHLLELKM